MQHAYGIIGLLLLLFQKSNYPVAQIETVRIHMTLLIKSFFYAFKRLYLYTYRGSRSFPLQFL